MSGPKVIPLTELGVNRVTNLCPVDPFSPPPISFDDVEWEQPAQHVSAYIQPQLEKNTFWGPELA